MNKHTTNHPTNEQKHPHTDILPKLSKEFQDYKQTKMEERLLPQLNGGCSND